MIVDLRPWHQRIGVAAHDQSVAARTAGNAFVTLFWMYGMLPYKEASLDRNRRSPRLAPHSVEDKTRIRRAAALHGMPVGAFVREAALREADPVIAHPPKARSGSLAVRLRGRATARLGTDEIVRLTRAA
jgi:uncharacterized protein (DUF1778 family)